MKKNKLFKKLLLTAVLLSTFTGLLCSQSWNQIGNDIDGEATGDFSGCAVSLSSDGSIVAIGAQYNDGSGTDAGHVRVFENQSGSWIQIGEDIDGEASFDASGISVSLSSDGSVVAIGAFLNDGNGGNSGHVRVFENQSGSWIQMGNDIDGEANGDYSGEAISLSSDGLVVAIGADRNCGSGLYAGHVRVFEFIAGSWMQVGGDINGEAANDRSGLAVSLNADGSRVAIGAPGNFGNGFGAGHVRVFENQAGSWQKIGNDIDGEAAEDGSGWAVSLNSDGTVVAIGAYSNDGNGINAGHVRIYEIIANTWTQIGNDIDGEAAYDELGKAVSLNSDGSIVAVGAYRNDGGGQDAGCVKIYENQSGSWVQLGSNINGEDEQDESGYAVSLNSNGLKVAIGAHHNDGNGSLSGHVRVYEYGSSTNIWTREIRTDQPVNGNILVYNMAGQLVSHSVVNGNFPWFKIEKTGLYIIKIQNGQTLIIEKVFVK